MAWASAVSKRTALFFGGHPAQETTQPGFQVMADQIEFGPGNKGGEGGADF